MSRLSAASVLLLLSLPSGFAVPLNPNELPALHILSAHSPAVDSAKTGEVSVQTDPIALPPQPPSANVSPLTGGVLSNGVLSNGATMNSLSSPDEPVPIEAGIGDSSGLSAFDTTTPPSPNELPQSASGFVSTAGFIDILAQLTSVIGNFFKVLPGESNLPFPVVGSSNTEQFFQAAAEQAATRPFPITNGSAPPFPSNGTERKRERSIRGKPLNTLPLAPVSIAASPGKQPVDKTHAQDTTKRNALTPEQQQLLAAIKAKNVELNNALKSLPQSQLLKRDVAAADNTELLSAATELLTTIVKLNPNTNPRSTAAHQPLAPRDLDFSPKIVRDFIRKWHTIGTSLANIDPDFTSGLMEIFVDPSKGPYPEDAQYMGRFGEKVRTFIIEYYTFSQFLADVGVQDEDKVWILEGLFGEDVGARKMRRGVRTSV